MRPPRDQILDLRQTSRGAAVDVLQRGRFARVHRGGLGIQLAIQEYAAVRVYQVDVTVVAVVNPPGVEQVAHLEAPGADQGDALRSFGK